MRLRSRFGHAKQAAGQNHRLESKFWPVRVVGTLNRNAPVGFGERTRPACCRRRRAVGFCLHHLDSRSGLGKWWDEVCGATPPTTRQRRVLPMPTPPFKGFVPAEGICRSAGVEALFGWRFYKRSRLTALEVARASPLALCGCVTRQNSIDRALKT
jgi:hypothetical protein